jgi:hypothetical protein
MIRLRYWSVWICVLLTASAVQAQEKQPATPPAEKQSPWVIDRTLNVTPQAPPAQVFKYRLLPLTSELKEGNAVPIYLRLVHNQSDASQKHWRETPEPWNELPVDKIPLDEARKFLDGRRFLLRQIELGARRRTAEWNYTLDQGKPIEILLPDAQSMRSYSPMLVLQVRVALADGDFVKAAHHIQTGLAFSRHVSEGPFLINSLVGIAIARQMSNTIADFIERPNAPNLYWTLVDLPHPLIDFRRQYDQEYQMAELQFPELTDLDRERTAEQWDGVLRRLRTELKEILLPLQTGKTLSDYFPKDCEPGDSAAKSPDLPTARQYVVKAKGIAPDKVAAMPPAQVLLLYIYGTFQEDRDNWFRGFNLPYPQAVAELESSNKRLRELPIAEGHVLGRMLFPGQRPPSIQARQERTLLALQVVEALRIYAAAHEGRLPDKLDDVKEVPIPDDLGTGRPFEYSRDGETATVISKIPNDPVPKNGIRYRVTIRKK